MTLPCSARPDLRSSPPEFPQRLGSGGFEFGNRPQRWRDVMVVVKNHDGLAVDRGSTLGQNGQRRKNKNGEQQRKGSEGRCFPDHETHFSFSVFPSWECRIIMDGWRFVESVTAMLKLL